MVPWKSQTVSRRQCGAYGFNGATAMVPWKSHPPRDKAGRPNRFNGATAMMPWKRSFVVLMASTLFHASMGPRRWCRGRVRTSLVFFSGIKASMGPRRWCRGRDFGFCRWRPTSIGFNGATAMVPWKSGTWSFVQQAGIQLQWGHGDGAVEEVRGRHHCFVRHSGFNGATAMVPWKRARPPDRLKQRT